jgi:hypothetical protein
MKVLLLALFLVSCGKNASMRNSEVIYLNNFTQCEALYVDEWCHCVDRKYRALCRNMPTMTQFVECLAEKDETLLQNQCKRN